MKKIAVAIVVGAMAFTAMGDYVVNVFHPGYFEAIDGTGDLSKPFLPNDGDTALIQLFWAGSDGVANNLGGDTLNPGGLGVGDDVLIGTATYVSDGNPPSAYAPISVDIQGAAGVFLGADVFARIFNTVDASLGSTYYEGTVQAVSDLDPNTSPPPLPSGYQLAPAAINKPFGTVIPEPATIGLMGIAGLGMYLARRKTHR